MMTPSCPEALALNSSPTLLLGFQLLNDELIPRSEGQESVSGVRLEPKSVAVLLKTLSACSYFDGTFPSSSPEEEHLLGKVLQLCKTIENNQPLTTPHFDCVPN